MSPQKNQPIDPATGLVGWPKVVTQLAAVGVMLCLFAWLLFTARSDVMSIMQQMREDHREDRREFQRGNDETRDQFRRLADDHKREHTETRAALVRSLDHLTSVATELKALKQSIPAKPPMPEVVGRDY